MSVVSSAVMPRVPERHAVSARRRARERTMQVLLALSALGAATLLVIILGYVIVRGAPALNIAFFTERPLPFGVEGGGVGPAVVGTVILSVLAGVLAIPVGIASAIFVTEFRSGRLAPAVRFAAELIAGLPSIVVGVFVWAFLVRGIIGNYAALAGAIALAIIMIPIVARTVEEVLRLVPQSLREAGLALGAPRGRVVLSIVVPTARTGIATAVVLAVARAAGETAPLLLTALGNLFFSTDLLKPISALPIQIYQYAASPYDDWHTKAWGSSLVLVGVIALLSLALRLAVRRGAR
jgi:phosphate transport system permease protein